MLAEGEAARDIGRSQSADYFPQPVSARHVPLPRIGGLIYDDAREMLMQAGWQPFLNHWSKVDDLDIAFGNGPYFWNKGFHEIQAACPTGLAQCSFEFKDAYENLLIVVTEGEAAEDVGIAPRVRRWWFELAEQ